MSVTFGAPKEFQVTQSPQNLPPVFNGEKLVVYATLKSQKAFEKTDCTATLKGNMLGDTLEHKVPFVLDSSTTAPSLPVIHHLAVKALITDWEAAQKEKKSIVDLSTESSVISSHTAFIAVDEESSEPVSGSMKVYDIQAHMEHAYMFGGGGGRGGLRSRRAMAPYASLSLGAPMATNSAPMATNSAPMMKRKKGAFFGKRRSAAPVAKSFAHEEDRCMPLNQGRSIPTNTLEDLISAQQLDGTWEMTSLLAQLIGKPLADLEAACPIGREGVGATVWATVLAVSLLRSRYSSQQDEWELIAMKAESWLKKQSLPSDITLEKIFQDAQKLLQ